MRAPLEPSVACAIVPLRRLGDLEGRNVRIPRATLLGLTRPWPDDGSAVAAGRRPAAAPVDSGYWLRSCDGFHVWGPTGRVGVVAEVRERDLVVAAGLFRRRLLLVPVAAVVLIEPDRTRLHVAYDPTAVTIREHGEGDVVEVMRPQARSPDLEGGVLARTRSCVGRAHPRRTAPTHIVSHEHDVESGSSSPRSGCATP